MKYLKYTGIFFSRCIEHIERNDTVHCNLAASVSLNPVGNRRAAGTRCYQEEKTTTEKKERDGILLLCVKGHEDDHRSE